MGTEIKKSNLQEINTNVERELTKLISDEMNDNSKNVIFNLGFWTNIDDDGRHKLETGLEEPDYDMENRYVPMNISHYDGDITPIEGIFLAEYDVPITFQVTTYADDSLEKAINAIEEVKNRLRGQLKRLSVKIPNSENEYEKFNVVVATSNLSPIGDLDIQAGEMYAFATLNFYFTVGYNISFGNQVHIYMRKHNEGDYQRIYPLDPSTSRDNTPESYQTFNTRQTQNINQEATLTIPMQLVVLEDDLHYSILKDVNKKTRLNEPFDVKMVFHKFNENDEFEEAYTLEETMLISQGHHNFAIGEEQIVDFSLIRYSDYKNKMNSGG